jgi:hypothetical protein
MRWPFRRKRAETDLRVYRDPKSGELMLRLQGSIGWPQDVDRGPILQLAVTLTSRLTETAARQLRDQLDAFLPSDHS